MKNYWSGTGVLEIKSVQEYQKNNHSTMLKLRHCRMAGKPLKKVYGIINYTIYSLGGF